MAFHFLLLSNNITAGAYDLLTLMVWAFEIRFASLECQLHNVILAFYSFELQVSIRLK